MKLHQSQDMGRFYPLTVLASLRGLQFALAVATVGLYAAVLANKISSDESVFLVSVASEIVAVISIITLALCYLLSMGNVSRCLCDSIIFLLWTGLFAASYQSMRYLGKVRKETNTTTWSGGFTRFQVAVYLNIFCMVLWLGTAIESLTSLFLARKRERSLEKANTHPDPESREVFD